MEVMDDFPIQSGAFHSQLKLPYHPYIIIIRSPFFAAQIYFNHHLFLVKSPLNHH
jgi:hypothetical protein